MRRVILPWPMSLSISIKYTTKSLKATSLVMEVAEGPNSSSWGISYLSEVAEWEYLQLWGYSRQLQTVGALWWPAVESGQRQVHTDKVIMYNNIDCTENPLCRRRKPTLIYEHKQPVIFTGDSVINKATNAPVTNTSRYTCTPFALAKKPV